MDHGILNVPLAKRGDIDRQIDRYKATAARERLMARREAAAVRDEQRAKAKALVASAPTERIADFAVRCDVTPATMVKRLRSDAHWQPGLVIWLLA